jgi:hypothetical protein
MKSAGFLLLIALFFTQVEPVFSQSSILEVNKWDNTVMKIELNKLQKITFSGTDMNLNLKSGDVNVIATSSIRNLIFGMLTGKKNLDFSKDPVISPNPAIDFIRINNLPSGNQDISVFSLSGQLLLQQRLSAADESISLAGLRPGIYLLKLDQEVLKFSKL